MIILPHGAFPLLPATLAAMAWMTALSLDGCDYVRLTGPAVETLTQSNVYPYVEIGYNSYRVPSFYTDYERWEMRFSDGCIPYNSNNYLSSSSSSSNGGSKSLVEASETFLKSSTNNRSRNAAGGGGDVIDPTNGFFWSLGSTSHKIATIVGGSATLFLWVPCLCMSYTERTWRIGGIQLIIAAFFHLFSMVWFWNVLCLEKGSKCHMFYGSNSSIASFGLYFVSFLCVFWKYPKPIIVKLVRERIEEEFQRYQTHGRIGLRSGAGGAGGGGGGRAYVGRPGMRRGNSVVTDVTEMENQSQVSHTSEQYINPASANPYRHQTRSTFGLEQREVI
jgi:hypothetical protein